MRRKLSVLSLGLLIAGLGVLRADPPDQTKAPTHGPVDCSPGLAWWAIPSDTGSYLGYYVGGGCGRPHKAEPRTSDEGTWGWDYQGWLIRRRIVLEWWHGRRYQGGLGSYRTDGPKLYHHEEGEK